MLIILIGALLAQCSDEEYASSVSTDQISFSEPQMSEWLPSEGGASKTRAAEVTNKNFKNTYSKYMVYAWAKSNDGSYLKYISGDKVTSKTGTFSETSYFWPSSDYQMRFLAMAPTPLENSVIYDENGISMGYKVPDEATEQSDLLCALCDPSTPGESVELEFAHMLTSVQIKLKDGLKSVEGIASVSLKNVYSSGTLTYTQDGSLTWENIDVKKTFTSTHKSKAYLASGDYTFMMLPQEFTSEDGDSDAAEIVLKFVDGQSLSCKLADTDKNWEAGHRVTYTLAYDADVNVFDVPAAIDISADDTSFEIPITSRLETTKDGELTVTRRDWEIVSDIPDWLTGNSQKNTLAGKDTLELSANKADSYVEGDVWLREQPAKSGTVDLSDGCRNTANCYIVNAAGTYKFPLVYGNGLKNGEYNREAYEQDGYYNHLGAAITSPYIYENDKCNVGSVELLWQDREGLITNVELSDDNHYITFTTARQSDIGQGNALIAVRDNSKKKTIMWSWHIWVTFYELDKSPDIDNYWRDKVIKPRETGSKSEYTIMPINLGWCDSSKYYEGHSCDITVRQKDTGTEKTIKVIQRPKVEGVYGSQPYYQWCRKDPFMAADPKNGFQYSSSEDDFIHIDDKCAYNIEGEPVAFQSESLSGSIKNYITKPNVFNHGTNQAWWNGTIPWENTFKTIYDPSPVGYRIVEREALTVISTKDGEVTIGEKTINTPFTNKTYNEYNRYPEIEDANGWVFYCYPKVEGVVNPLGGTFFMPISLYRRHGGTYKGQVMYDNKSSNHFYGSGTVWATIATVEDPGGGFCMGFYGHHVKSMPTTETSQILYGRAVRCMKDD
jgi:hypothetical protein